MHLDEEVKPVAQKPLVLNWGHAVEQLEELFLLLGGRWKHVLHLDVVGLFRQAERAIGGSAGLGLASEEEGSVLVCRAWRIGRREAKRDQGYIGRARSAG